MRISMTTSITKLRPHPLSLELYGNKDESDDLLKQSLQVNGLLDPLKVAADGVTVVSGARRLRLLKELEIAECYILKDTELSDPIRMRIAVVEHNRYRKKTVDQLLAEARVVKEAYLALHGGNASDRTLAGHVADTIGISKTSARRLLETQEAVEQAKQDGNVATSEKLKQQTSITKAYAQAAQEQEPAEEEQEEDPLETARTKLGGLTKTIEKVVRHIDALNIDAPNTQYHAAAVQYLGHARKALIRWREGIPVLTQEKTSANQN